MLNSLFFKVIFPILFLSCISLGRCQNASDSILLTKITINHPCLILNDSITNIIPELINSDTYTRKVYDYIRAECEDILIQPQLEHKLNGRRMFGISTEALRRICYLSFVYRITQEERYADRAIKEIRAVCNFIDWNPKHFLDVAEMTMAVAIGFDWLYEKLTENDKKLIIEAIDQKAFSNVLFGRHTYYLRTNNNWNSICNAGMVFGAIALMNELPDKSIEIIKKCIDSNPKVLEVYGPDGCYPEGYDYWGYGTLFEVLLLDALNATYGCDFGLSDESGFMKTGKYIKFMTAPSGESFNFSDNSGILSGKIALWWFASKTNDNSLIYGEDKWMKYTRPRFSEIRLLPSLLIFASRLKKQNVQPPKYNSFNGDGLTPVYIYRSGWDSEKDTYLAVKGGSASTSHAHMDAGSFVYEYDGVRWAIDLGSQDYGTLERQNVDLWNFKQDGQRWDILRMRNDYHNTLTVDNSRHNVKGHAKIDYVFNASNRKGAVIDMTSTLGKVKSAKRAISLDENNHLSVIDSIFTDNKPINLLWIMVTPAKAVFDKEDSIRLELNGKTMKLTFDSPLQLHPLILSNKPLHPFDQSNEGTIRVGYHVNIPANTKSTIKVYLTPL